MHIYDSTEIPGGGHAKDAAVGLTKTKNILPTTTHVATPLSEEAAAPVLVPVRQLLRRWKSFDPGPWALLPWTLKQIRYLSDALVKRVIRLDGHTKIQQAYIFHRARLSVQK